MVTNIYFLPTISISCQQIRLWEFIIFRYAILRFDVILQHDLPNEQCLLNIRVIFGGKTKRPCFDFFIHWLIKQITNTNRNHFSSSYENRSIKRYKQQKWTLKNCIPSFVFAVLLIPSFHWVVIFVFRSVLWQSFILNFDQFCDTVDCKKVLIFAYSSARKHSNERSEARLKTEQDWGKTLKILLLACEARVRL